MATIGNVTSYIIKTADQLENQYETNVSGKFTVNAAATYEQVDTVSRALIANLSTLNYQDTILITKISVTEQLAEEG